MCHWSEPFPTAVLAGIPAAVIAIVVWYIEPYFILTDGS